MGRWEHDCDEQGCTELERIEHTQQEILMDLSALLTAVAAETSADKSAEVLLGQLAGAITAAGTDPAALAQITQTLTDNASQLAAAVTANTPAAPAAPTNGAPADTGTTDTGTTATP